MCCLVLLGANVKLKHIEGTVAILKGLRMSDFSYLAINYDG